MTTRKTIHASFPVETYEALRRAAKAEMRTQSATIAYYLTRGLREAGFMDDDDHAASACMNRFCSSRASTSRGANS